MKNHENIIVRVEDGSIAAEIGIEPGDALIEINGKPVADVFDYRYLINDEYLEILLRDAGGEEYIAEIEKEYDEDLGLAFESGLMDDARSCRNKCIFCFIDQLPKGMRDTLYFKDDDTRLSFLQGNYVTLTNMSEKDIEHIIYYHLSPINISVHTTDMELRRKMLNNKNAGNLIERMNKLAQAGIDMNLQVVLCRGINDGERLNRTIADLSELMPRAVSLSVVPIGLTKYRDGLYPMAPFDKETAGEAIDIIEGWQRRLRPAHGSNFVYAADELYLKAERPLPAPEQYDGFPQYENGVGMLSLLEQEFTEELKRREFKPQTDKAASLATGAAAYPLISRLCSMLEEASGLKINVYLIENKFFGEMITVSGLLTGRDIINGLRGRKLGNRLILPESLLRNGTRTLLDDITLDDIERELGVSINIAFNSGKSLINALLDLEEDNL